MADYRPLRGLWVLIISLLSLTPQASCFSLFRPETWWTPVRGHGGHFSPSQPDASSGLRPQAPQWASYPIQTRPSEARDGRALSPKPHNSRRRLTYRRLRLRQSPWTRTMRRPLDRRRCWPDCDTERPAVSGRARRNNARFITSSYDGLSLRSISLSSALWRSGRPLSGVGSITNPYDFRPS